MPSQEKLQTGLLRFRWSTTFGLVRAETKVCSSRQCLCKMKVNKRLLLYYTVITFQSTRDYFLLSRHICFLVQKLESPRGYSIWIGAYEWVVDKHTIIEAITNCGGMKVPLPAPRKLNTLPFSAIERLDPGVEFDLLAVIANCSTLQHMIDQSKHFREAIMMDLSYKIRHKISDNNLNEPSVRAGCYIDEVVEYNEQMLVSYTL